MRAVNIYPGPLRSATEVRAALDGDQSRIGASLSRGPASALTCCPAMRVLARPRCQSAMHIAVIWRRLWPGPEAYGGAGAVLL